MDKQSVAEVMERDIARLREARPSLASRIERAEHILVTQLSVTNGHRPIKVKISANSRSYTVRSGSKLSRSYSVDPASWTCECPDHRRRNAACKHVMACWLLERAFGLSLVPVEVLEQLSNRVEVSAGVPCSGCGSRHPRRDLVELTEDNHDNLTYFHGDGLCRECADNAGVVY